MVEIDAWVARKIGLDSLCPLSRDDLEKYQRRKLAEVVYYAKTHSIFYGERLGSSTSSCTNMSSCAQSQDPLNAVDSATAPRMTVMYGMPELPFMTASDIVERGSEMLCVPASQVSRIVSLETSGSSEGERKSIYFTEEDQELMVDYVANGLGLMFAEDDAKRDCRAPLAMTMDCQGSRVGHHKEINSCHCEERSDAAIHRPTQVMLILMPAERPGSIGDLVAKGVARIGVNAIPYGVAPSDGSFDDEIIELIIQRGVTSILATPQAALRLARKMKEAGEAGGKEFVPALDAGSIKSVLISGDYVSSEIRSEIERLWNCKVYEHYGMTEMGLGGAMACEIRDGYHIREADLYIEIIDPDTGKVVPDGEEGEIVFTTLTRQAMPLIRYRTGDISRIIPEPCPCGSILKRLARVGSRGQTKNY
jgi:phenylacetate-coenzyme A ligase PaaK-like adenylate-forming protein